MGIDAEFLYCCFQRKAVMRRDLAISAGLLALTLAAYWSVGSFEFLRYDDNQYVFENPHVAFGLNGPDLRWALTANVTGHWHPLTVLSHQLDVQLFGLKSGGHHAVNLAFHAINSLLVYWLFRRMTGEAWCSAMVAALFAMHPLNVESVAWIAERKNVLSTFLGLLSLIAYVGYVRKPRFWRYLLVLVLFALGLTAKSMLVTLPFVFLLLDLWPLGRIALPASSSTEKESPPESAVANEKRQAATKRDRSKRRSNRRPPRFAGNSRDFWQSASRLILEKTPFFVLSLLCSAATVVFMKGLISSLEVVSMPVRLGNALPAYVAYLGKTFWPFSLAARYPLNLKPDSLPVFLSLLTLVAISVLAVWMLRRRRLYFAVGWFWFLGTLVPVIGLVHVGQQSMADRYAYTPLIGIFVMLVWGAADLARTWRIPPAIVAAVGASILLGCFFRTRDQLQYWRNTEALYVHALDLIPENFPLHKSLFASCLEQNRFDESMAHARAYLKYRPDDADVHTLLAATAIERKRWDEAEAHLKIALKANSPSYAAAHSHYGVLLSQRGNREEALNHFREAVRVAPDNTAIRENFAKAATAAGKWDDAAQQWRAVLRLDPRSAQAAGTLAEILLKQGRFDEAEIYGRQAIEIDPQNLDYLHNLAAVLLCAGKTRDAMAEWRKILRLQPDNVAALNDIAWIDATSADPALRNRTEAVNFAEKAAQLTKQRSIDVLDSLAAAYAEAGRFAEAVAAATKAVELAESSKRADQAAEIRIRVALYQSKKPYRELKR
jgi:tetratricopeptide (TPR) repeat protein